jgi:hypothetical protein
MHETAGHGETEHEEQERDETVELPDDAVPVLVCQAGL